MVGTVESTAGNGGVRIGDAERERAATALGEHLRAGRLDVTEYDERLLLAYAARTAPEISILFTDLPGGSPLGPYAAGFGPPAPRRRVRHAGVPVILVVVLILSMISLAVLHLPPFFLFPVLWFMFARRRSHGRGTGPGWR